MTVDLEPITPDPPPWSHRPVLRQQWMELASFHWRYDRDAVQRLLPPGVTVDTFDSACASAGGGFDIEAVLTNSTLGNSVANCTW